MPSEPNKAPSRPREQELSAALRLWEEQPQDPAVNRRVGWLLGQLERPAEALPYFQRAVEADPQHALGWYYLAIAATKAGARDTAQHAFEQFERLAPEDALGLGQRANVLRQAGEPERAVEYAQQALEQAPPPHLRAWLHRVMASCHESLGDTNRQQQQLEAALRADGENPENLAELAHLQYLRHRQVTVLPLAEELAARRPEDPLAWYALGAVANRSGDWWQARTALEKARELGYDPVRCARELGSALSQLGEYREAIAAWEQALPAERDAADRAWLHASLGDAYHRLKEPEKAREQFQAAVEADPGSARAHQLLGACLVELNEYGAALPHLAEATRLAPDHAGAWYALGRVLAWQGDLEPAREALERAIAAAYPNGEARAQLAWVYQRQGKRGAAVEQAKRALRQPLPKKWRAWMAGIVNDSQRQRR